MLGKLVTGFNFFDGREEAKGREGKYYTIEIIEVKRGLYLLSLSNYQVNMTWGDLRNYFFKTVKEAAQYLLDKFGDCLNKKIIEALTNLIVPLEKQPKKDKRVIDEKSVNMVKDLAIKGKIARDKNLNDLTQESIDYIIEISEGLRKIGLDYLDLFLAEFGYSCFYGSGKNKIRMLKQALNDLSISRFKSYQISNMNVFRKL